jgi:hypothetical protein
MKSVVCILLFSCIAISIALADTIYMKNGVKIEGEVVTVGADSITIKTSSGLLTIAAHEVERIETIETRPREINEGAIPKSIKTVGYGCLGGAILGGGGTLVTILSDGFNNGYVASTVIIGSTIAGILIGASIGSK